MKKFCFFSQDWEGGREGDSADFIFFSVMQLSVNSDSADVAGGGAGAQLQQQQEEQVHGVDITASSHASLGGDSAGGGGGSPGRGSDHVLERPAKVIPCPRCASMNTKFCYFNNYSVKQPRYFCRQCQRYWTMGGTLRNVPVGGGSRKKSRSQRSEPYHNIRSAATQGGVPSSGALSSSSSPALLQQTVGFQQLLMQDVNLPYNMTGYEPQENYLEHLPNPAAGLFYPVMNKTQLMMSPHSEVSPMHAMYAAQGSNPAANHPVVNTNGSSYYCTLNGLELQMNQGDNTIAGQVTQWGNSVPEDHGLQQQAIWNESKHDDGSALLSASRDEHNNIGNSPQDNHLHGKAEGDEASNMLSHLDSENKPSAQEGSLAPNSSSPPHGSSTIDEEGSTPTNGYSTNGYEEGDAVSSIWPDLEFFH